MGGGAKLVSVFFHGPAEVVDVVSVDGTLTQIDAGGARVLGHGVTSASMAQSASNEVVLDIIFSDGSLRQFDPFGDHFLGDVP